MDTIKIITTEDGSHSLYREDLKETYHSFHGALQESVHVFINMGLKYFHEKHTPGIINILEVGFGTGLNALLSADYAIKNKITINFDTLETIPLQKDIYENLNYASPMGMEGVFLKMHEGQWNYAEEITKDFYLKKINQSLQEFNPSKQYDVIFFDAFAPSKQPELWEKDLLKKVYDLTAEKGVFTTYCAKGQLKRDLKEIGYTVTTLPGAPGKKEMVRGEK